MIEKISLEEWHEKGKRLFGDYKKWKFKCCNCGNIQTIEDFENLNISNLDPETVVFFSCIGRWIEGSQGTLGNKKSPCNYTLGGLFDIGKVKVIDEKDVEHSVFEFAE